jgi:hypothetical protein
VDHLATTLDGVLHRLEITHVALNQFDAQVAQESNV